jgi:hypothetical protein
VKRLRFALLGAALAYFLDRENGARRRAQARGRLTSLANRGRRSPELMGDLVDRAQDVQAAPAEHAQN